MRNEPAAKTFATIPIGGLELGAELATRRISPCAVGDCGGQCCRFGAIVEPDEQARIAPLIPRLLPRLRPEARRVIRRHGWVFRQNVRERYADPDKLCRATRVAAGLCVFALDPHAGGCALHQLALEDGQPIEAYKPLECLLFPLSDAVRGTVHLHTWSGYPCTAEAPDGPPAWRTLDRELRLLIGDEGYDQLGEAIDALARSGVTPDPRPYPDPAPVARGRRPGCRPAPEPFDV